MQNLTQQKSKNSTDIQEENNMKHKLRRTLAYLLALTLLTCPAMAASPFPDVDENAEYAEAVEYLNDAGVMQGDDKGNFNPDKTVTRAEMAAIICRMLDETDLVTSDMFSDVPTTHWANKYIAKAAELGIVSGYGNGRFGPNDSVTYEQAVTMVVRAWDMEVLAVAAGGYPDGYVATADEQGFLKGVQAQIGENLNRAVVAQILYNVLNF